MISNKTLKEDAQKLNNIIAQFFAKEHKDAYDEANDVEGIIIIRFSATKGCATTALGGVRFNSALQSILDLAMKCNQTTKQEENPLAI